MVLDIKKHLASGSTQLISAHAENLYGTIYFFQSSGDSRCVDITGSLSGGNENLSHNNSSSKLILLHSIL